MPDFNLLAYFLVWAAALAVALRWRHEIPRAPAPVRRRAIDFQCHTVTHTDSGEARIDFATMLWSFGRIYS